MNPEPAPDSATEALLRVAVLSVEESTAAVDSGDTSGIEFLDQALLIAGDFVGYRDKVADYDDVVLRYVSRMGGRATPFGVFAGTAPLRIGRHRKLELAPRGTHDVRVRLDVGALESALAESVAAFAATVPYVVNPTVQVRSGFLRYSKEGNANAAIVEIRATPTITAILRLCGGAGMSAEGVADRLGRTPEDREKIVGFVQQLAAKELLNPDTALLFHGVEPYSLALDSLTAMGDLDKAAVLQKLSASVCGVRPLAEFAGLDLRGPWEEAEASVPELAGTSVPHRYHVELEMRAPEATLEEACASSLQLAAEKLVELFPPVDALASFKEAFRLRYEDTRAPLLEVLDPDQGVLPSSKRRSSQLAAAAEFRRAERGDAVLELSEATVRALALGGGAEVDLLTEPSAQHRQSAAKHPVRVLQAVLLDRYEGRFSAQLLAGYRHGSLGPLSRFAVARPEMFAPPEEQVSTAAAGGPIVAELLFAPTGRYGNIVVRPRLHADSVALHGSRTGTIAPADLDISLTNGNDVVLWHRPTGRQVLLDLNTAHNVLAYHNSPIYTFLARVRDWGATMWEWSGLGRLPQLPRVVCGEVILSPQRWLIKREEIVAALRAPSPAARLRQAVPGFGDRRWLGFGQDDNILTIDTYSDRSVASLLARATGKKATAFIELPQLEAPAVRSDRGRHTAEVMLPVKVRNERPLQYRLPPAFDRQAGRDWLYARFHCGSGDVDRILLRAAETVGRLRAGGAAERWFFVRYDDGVHHVRIRVLPRSAEHRAAVYTALEALGRALSDEGLVSRVVFDTYVPEAARYGGYDGLALAERLFSLDSDEVVSCIAAGRDESERLDQGVLDVLAWSGAVTDDLAQQVRLVGAWRDSMGIGPTKRTGKLARERRPEFGPLPEAGPALRGCIEDFRRHLAPLGEQSLRHSLGSAMHMHFNRLFETDARRLEWLAYELAARTLREHQARGAQPRQEGTA